MERTRAWPVEPKSFKDSHLVAERLAHLDDEHIAPLSEFVRALRRRRGGDESVPWFDPDGGGIRAEVLLLLEAPGPKAVGAGHFGPLKAGSGIISADNNDETARTVFTLRDEVGLARDRLVAWNAVPWFVGNDDGNIKGAGDKDTDEGLPHLLALVELLTELRVVVTMGRPAQRAWAKLVLKKPNRLVVIPSFHPSPVALGCNPGARDQIRQAFTLARLVLDQPREGPTPIAVGEL